MEEMGWPEPFIHSAEVCGNSSTLVQQADEKVDKEDDVKVV